LSLVGKSALVTGATGGIGRAIVDALFAAGVSNLVRVSRSGSTLPIPRGATVTDLICNFEQVDSTEHLATVVAAMPGGLDILVHSAGSFHTGTVENTSSEVLEQQLQVNFKAPFVLTKVLLPRIRQAKGQIVFVNSSIVTGVQRGSLGAYSASKFALQTLADNLRAEVNGDGVRVMSIFPGRTATRMQEAIHLNEKKPYNAERLLQPADVAASIVHALLSPLSAEITDIHIRPFLK
jgi:NAD(P)-dependent dehydrogenase (short-subunit alcohol dehydrogenase family)